MKRISLLQFILKMFRSPYFFLKRNFQFFDNYLGPADLANPNRCSSIRVILNNINKTINIGPAIAIVTPFPYHLFLIFCSLCLTPAYSTILTTTFHRYKKYTSVDRPPDFRDFLSHLSRRGVQGLHQRRQERWREILGHSEPWNVAHVAAGFDSGRHDGWQRRRHRLHLAEDRLEGLVVVNLESRESSGSWLPRHLCCIDNARARLMGSHHRQGGNTGPGW